MPIPLSPLPYREDALEPWISARTVDVHYHKHHNGYVTRMNDLLEDLQIQADSLENVVILASRCGHTALFNAASQAWNHQFFWESLTRGGSQPSPRFLLRIERDFGSLDALKQQIREAALAQFGSGWVWLAWNGERLQVTRTANADSPLMHGQRALMTIDVWEHAYYLDYQSDRGRFVDSLMNHLVDWKAAAARWETAAGL